MTDTTSKKTEAPTQPKHHTPVAIDRPRSFTLGLMLGAAALLLIGFLAGRMVERTRVRHFLGWQNNYQRIFFGPTPFERPMDRGPFGPPPPMMRGFALLGNVLTVQGDKLTLQSRDNIEQSVVLTDQTVIRRDGADVSRGDIKPGQRVAVFGEPKNEGHVVAKLIRIFAADENPIP